MTNKSYKTKEELSELFELRDGELWRKDFVRTDGKILSARLVVNIANCSRGYCKVRCYDKMRYYHQIVWILYNDNIPDNKIVDHIDGNKINNEINNLRLVTHSENSRNSYKHRNGRLLGCYLHKQTNKWHSQLYIQGKQKYLGYFDTELEAYEAYCRAEENFKKEG